MAAAFQPDTMAGRSVQYFDNIGAERLLIEATLGEPSPDL